MPPFGVVVFETRHRAGFVPSMLNREFSAFLLIIAGDARIQAGGRKFQVGPHGLVHLPSHADYSYLDVPGRPVTFYTIQYRNEMLPTELARQLASLGILHWNLQRTGSLLFRSFHSGCKEMLVEQLRQKVGWTTVLVSRLLGLVVSALRFSLGRDPLHQLRFERTSDSVTRVASYAARLETEFSLPLGLNEAARATGLSRRRFTALFRSVTGQSWHKHLLELRLEHARQLLLQTEKTITALALESGFEDVSHFNHRFKQVLGCSPSAFRSGGGIPVARQVNPLRGRSCRPA